MARPIFDDAEWEERVRRQTENRVTYFADHPEEIGQRLAELDEEWDMDRVLMAKAAGAALIGACLGLKGSRLWMLLPALAGACLLKASVHGWRPRFATARRMGVRTAEEIDLEREALKILRGDFEGRTEASDSASGAKDRARRALGEG
ncbi:hypothetical protein FKB34_15540 [Glycocaulis profundi]|nr:hypothetical protein FKB34_15540 [Glycocaulis profundi]